MQLICVGEWWTILNEFERKSVSEGIAGQMQRSLLGPHNLNDNSNYFRGFRVARGLYRQ